MEPNENHHHHHQQPLSSYFTTNPTTTITAAPQPPPTNGLASAGDGPHMVYPHSVPSSAAVASPLIEPSKRKRGRPRKYGSAELALAAKKTASFSSKERRDSGPSMAFPGSSRKNQSAALGNAGQGFMPHVIDVAPGEDVGQKIIQFMQHSKREICILSASGSISNASVRQPTGGSVTYQGHFSIISLSGSFIHIENGGRTGALSVCLCSSEGQIIGGGVGGPLEAAGPVQVIVGSFLIDTKKDIGTGGKTDASGSGMHSPGSVAAATSGGYHPSADNSGRIQASGHHDLTIGTSNFMMQPRGMHMTPTRPMEWRGVDLTNPPGYEFSGVLSHSPSGSFSSFPSS